MKVFLIRIVVLLSSVTSALNKSMVVINSTVGLESGKNPDKSQSTASGASASEDFDNKAFQNLKWKNWDHRTPVQTKHWNVTTFAPIPIDLVDIFVNDYAKRYDSESSTEEYREPSASSRPPGKRVTITVTRHKQTVTRPREQNLVTSRSLARPSTTREPTTRTIQRSLHGELSNSNYELLQRLGRRMSGFVELMDESTGESSDERNARLYEALSEGLETDPTMSLILAYGREFASRGLSRALATSEPTGEAQDNGEEYS